MLYVFRRGNGRRAASLTPRIGAERRERCRGQRSLGISYTHRAVSPAFTASPVRRPPSRSMNASIISALAGLIGAAIGGLTSGLAAWFAQKTQTHLQWLVHERGRRQDLYKEFIEAASRCYADALLHEKPEMPVLVELYAKIGRMRLLSSPSVIASAEQIGRKINETYLEPNKTFPEVQQMVDSNTIDILGDFSKACREEFESLHTKKF